ncbi:MAG: COX15/CtaA family protein [Chitinophagaceae bacterium]|nr:COX15/CtaA family protein [Chitinophagaceae bacterium]
MQAQKKAPSKKIALWLLSGVAMIVVQIVLGGITRLTGSGLSITEWDILTGTIPPLNHEQWLNEFEKYKQTPQYRLLNFDFTIRDFKFIYFWEWLHRLWARCIGIVFIIPFFYFLIKKRFNRSLVRPLIILFLLGALQGAVGWIMVASGLEGDAIYVKPVRLALHFVLALLLLCYTFWFALSLIIPNEQKIHAPGLRKYLVALTIILFIQLMYGALMAGHKAATAAPTWPDINGHLIPPRMFEQQPPLLNLLENKITVHFIHRRLAYLFLILVIMLTVRLFRLNGSALLRRTRWIPLFLTLLQILLGVFTVFTSVKIIPNKWGIFEWLAQLHQLTGMLLLLSLVWLLYFTSRKK